MAKKLSTEGLLTKHLGNKASKDLLSKIDKMIADGISSSKIQTEAENLIASYIEQGVAEAVQIKIGPLPPIKIKPIQVAIKPAIKPTPAIKINTGVSVRIGGPLNVRPR